MVRTVKVSNISPKATELQISQFFSFSGPVISVNLTVEERTDRVAYVTFADAHSLETALLLTGTLIEDMPIIVEIVDGPCPDNHHHALNPPQGEVPPPSSTVTSESIRKAESVASSLLASGYMLSKVALAKAKEFDQKHEMTNKATAHATAIDQKFAVSKKFNETSASLSRSVTTIDESYQVAAKARAAAAVAEKSLSSAGEQVLKNPYVASGKNWLFGAVGRLSGIVNDMTQMTMEKVQKAEEGRPHVAFASENGGTDERPVHTEEGRSYSGISGGRSDGGLRSAMAHDVAAGLPESAGTVNAPSASHPVVGFPMYPDVAKPV